MSSIKVLEVDIPNVGRPLNDGSPGSALYRVPIKLSEAPSQLWGEVAVQVWDRPPSYTTMHRPGIAYIEGDSFVLDGTTLEEVEQYHAETLKLVVDRTNQEVARLETQAQDEAARDQQQTREHEANVAEVGKRIKFE
jgi:hypothetical protein